MDDQRKQQVSTWFFEGMKPSAKVHHDKSSWFRVMCLTGLDYFGSLGYAPGIAALAAGLLSPSATLVLVGLTLFGALPMYKRVAEKSPYGQGSISMLERLFPGWLGKSIVLCLIGFAATDFIITITLSAADAAAHIAENHYVRMAIAHSHDWAFLQDRLGVTFALLIGLTIVFLAGFKEAISVAVIVVGSYLLLNVGVCAVGFYQISLNPSLFNDWTSRVIQQFHTPLNVTFESLILFPQLALGMSGFETGVAVMPLVKGDDSDTEENPVGRIRNTKKLLTAAAIIMSIFLLVSSVICTLLIPQIEFQAGGHANGRALAYLAHQLLGPIYGTFYDISTIFILWFSGASSLAGLLSLVPRYLPRFGMAPGWAAATRPLVLWFALVSFVVTWIFDANVDAQGGAYATGVLVLMSSAAFAVFLSVSKSKWYTRLAYLLITLIFTYTTVMNMVQRPEGLHIACFFILSVFVISFISRAKRSTELRARKVEFDSVAEKVLEKFHGQPMFLVAHAPERRDYPTAAALARQEHYLDLEHIADLVFLEIRVGDASEFTEDKLVVQGFIEDQWCGLRCTSAAVPNALASILLEIRNRFGKVPHLFVNWTEGNPLFYVLKYLFLGDGETAPVTREILRQAESDPKRRPKIHVV
jgi:hypothetical protein